MIRAALRSLFVFAVALVAAAIADPSIESASNAGWFGPGNFTDHSTLDVMPALIAGAAVVLVLLALRTFGLFHAVDGKSLLRASDQALADGPGRLLPLTYALQLALLFGMETLEQFAVYHHALGGTIWLGGPAVISLLGHAVACVAVAFIAARTIRAVAAIAARVISIVCAPATLRAQPDGLILRRSGAFNRYYVLPTRCRIGERAPPLPFDDDHQLAVRREPQCSPLVRFASLCSALPA